MSLPCPSTASTTPPGHVFSTLSTPNSRINLPLGLVLRSVNMHGGVAALDTRPAPGPPSRRSERPRPRNRCVSVFLRIRRPFKLTSELRRGCTTPAICQGPIQCSCPSLALPCQRAFRPTSPVPLAGPHLRRHCGLAWPCLCAPAYSSQGLPGHMSGRFLALTHPVACAPLGQATGERASLPCASTGSAWWTGSKKLAVHTRPTGVAMLHRAPKTKTLCEAIAPSTLRLLGYGGDQRASCRAACL